MVIDWQQLKHSKRGENDWETGKQYVLLQYEKTPAKESKAYIYSNDN